MKKVMSFILTASFVVFLATSASAQGRGERQITTANSGSEVQGVADRPATAATSASEVGGVKGDRSTIKGLSQKHPAVARWVKSNSERFKEAGMNGEDVKGMIKDKVQQHKMDNVKEHKMKNNVKHLVKTHPRAARAFMNHPQRFRHRIMNNR